MKIDSKINVVKTSHDLPSKKFEIANNAVAFQILSSKIYTKVPEAIVRELSTNAYDSHVEAGKEDVPFDVTLPNLYNPFLVIRDYGTGMSPEDVENVYTTYFESTRRDSNSAIGCMGLGSKSPFAYSDQFQVTSFYNGEACSYSLMIGEDGSPTITIVDVSDTDELNGLKITISIKSEDVFKFQSAASSIYQHFDVKPNISGANITFEEPDVLFEGKNFTLLKDDGYSNSIFVKMGQIVYSAGGCVSERKFYKSKIVIDAPIGACKITPSREELHYDQSTTDFINGAIDDALEEIARKAKELADLETSEFNQVVAFNKILKNVVGVKKKKIDFDSSEMRVIQLSMERYRSRIEAISSLTPSKNHLIVENDVDDIASQKWKRRIVYHYGDDSVLFVAIKDASKCESVFGKIAKKVSELTPVPRTYSGASNKRVFVKKYLKRMGSISNHWCNSSVDDIEDDSLIVIRDKYRPQMFGEEVCFFTLNEVIAACEEKAVFGVSLREWNKLKKNTKARLIDEVFVENIRSKFPNLTTEEYYGSKIHGSRRIAINCKKLALLGCNCDIVRKIAYVAYGKKDYAGLRLAIDLSIIDPPKFVDYEEILYKKYPMLSILDMDGYDFDKEAPIIYEYIKSMQNETT